MESSENAERFGGPPPDRRGPSDGLWGAVLRASRSGQTVSVLAPVATPGTAHVGVWKNPDRAPRSLLAFDRYSSAKSIPSSRCFTEGSI
jgi:hypothetical protein